MAYRRPVGVTVYKKGVAYEGYTLYTPLRGDGTVYLIDMEGRVVHSWKFPYPGNIARLLPNGNLLFDGVTEAGISTGPFAAGGKTGVVIEASWDGEILWEYKNPTLHHDCFRMSNGNTLMICWEKVPEEIASRVKGGISPEWELKEKTAKELRDKTLWSDKIIEVDKNGKVVWEWHAYEHLDPEKDVICPLCRRYEWTHCNSVFETKNGDILTSFRPIDTVAIIDKKSGNFKWKWGRGFIKHPHNPTELENGNILIFDNGTHIPEEMPRSRVVEVDPKENKIVWEYSDKENYLGFYSHAVSGAQRLPNGNTLICEGNRGRIFEVTPEKEIVWEYYNPHKGMKLDKFNVYTMRLMRLGYASGTRYDVARAYRYGLDYPGLKNL